MPVFFITHILEPDKEMYNAIMRKIGNFSLIVILTTLFSFFSITSVQAEEGWKINSFDSQLTLQSNGTIMVMESITVQFDEAKHGIYRDLPLTYHSQGKETGSKITVNSVSMDHSSIPYDQTDNRANLQLKIGDPNRTITGEHHYVIEYTIDGILRNFGDYDELYWNVTGADWPVAINKAQATVKLPEPGIKQSSCYQGEVGSTDTCSTTQIDNQTIQFSAEDLSDVGHGMTIAVGYTAGMVPIHTIAPPLSPWQAIIAWPSILGFIVTLGLGTALLIRKWW